MAETTKKDAAPKNIWAKLMDIQRSIKTFAASEDADKKDSRGNAEYKYTPGWEIIETIRKKMDDLSLMLVPDCKSQENKVIEYPVYKSFGGQAMSFLKKEVLVHVSVEFMWIDTETGQQAGPYTAFGYGANGTDKSGATAMSMAIRYFLLRFFNITTREKADEQDAHDSSNIPGISATDQPRNLSAAESVKAVGVPAYPQAPAQQPAAAPVYVQQAVYPAAQPYGGYPAPGAPFHPQGGFPPAPAPSPVNPSAGFNESDPAVQAAIAALMAFDKGTTSHQRVLNEQIGRLSAAGYIATTTEFLERLVNTAQAIRENGGRK